MTGYTVHTGSTEKFCQGWDEIFAELKTVKKSGQKKPAKKISAAKSRKKTAKAKQAAKKKKS